MTGFTNGQAVVRLPTKAMAVLLFATRVLLQHPPVLDHLTSQKAETRKCYLISVRWIKTASTARAMGGDTMIGIGAMIGLATIGRIGDETMIGEGGAEADLHEGIETGTQMTGDAMTIAKAAVVSSRSPPVMCSVMWQKRIVPRYHGDGRLSICPTSY
jgi:hypothetical protein